MFTTDEKARGLAYLEQLHEKYEGVGQDFFDYLEGLVQSKGLSYWEYIHLNSLLGLQVPRTNYKDEVIFITYHQITELYFKLIKQELEQLSDPNHEEFLEANGWMKRVNRCATYMKHICDSFDVMRSVMSREDFVNFRMALLPASGFQSVQFRHIEIMSTDLWSLLNGEARQNFDPSSLDIDAAYPAIYWKRGSIDANTGEKTLTLKEFERNYDGHLTRFIKRYEYRNLNYLYQNAPEPIQQNEAVRAALRSFDLYFNGYWRLSHLGASSRHLAKTEGGTGGTNWRKYLPPKEQQVLFYRSLWSADEINRWGEDIIKEKFRANIEKRWMKVPK